MRLLSYCRCPARPPAGLFFSDSHLCCLSLFIAIVRNWRHLPILWLMCDYSGHVVPSHFWSCCCDSSSPRPYHRSFPATSLLISPIVSGCHFGHELRSCLSAAVFLSEQIGVVGVSAGPSRSAWSGCFHPNQAVHWLLAYFWGPWVCLYCLWRVKYPCVFGGE